MNKEKRMSAPARMRESLARSWRAGLLTALCAAGVFAALPGANASAAGPMEITSFTAGLSDLQAGGHPDSSVAFELATEPTEGPLGQPGGNCRGGAPCLMVKGGAPKDVVIELPRGILGNPRNAQTCTVFELGNNLCPVGAQIGTARLGLIRLGFADPLARYALYNIVPERGEVAKFGIRVLSVSTFISVVVNRSGEYNLITTAGNIYDGFPLWGAEITIWGVPNDASHNPDRRNFASGNPGTFGASPSDPPRPFMVAPAECGVDGSATMRVRSWQAPDQWVTATSAPQQVTRCDKQVFAPRFDIWADNTERGKPTGLAVDISVPQTYDNPDGLATPPLRNAVVTLPEGMGVSSSSWYGLQGCTDEQLGLVGGVSNGEYPTCPDGSRIGSVSIQTPVLDETLEGGIYLGSQLSDDPESGDLFRIALVVANEDRGLLIKIPGRVHVNATTGQITTRFDNNPQLPFDLLRLRFKGGDRAPLIAPRQCGAATTHAELRGWGVESNPAVIDDTFIVTHDGNGNPCPLEFTPSFNAGSRNASAGKATTFTLAVGRDDDDLDLRTISVDFPPGLIAKIANVGALCPDAQANAGTCDESSRIGTVRAKTGPGANPPSLPGSVYLTESYGGGEFGLSINVPAQAGPFNLGLVTVRAAIHVDDASAQLRVVADPMPLILKGVLLRVREVVVDIDRPDFMLNPTSCAPTSIGGAIGSETGSIANVSSRFQVGDCGTLKFRPRMTLRVGRRGQVPRARTRTPLEVSLSMPAGDANNRRVQVTLPRTMNARLDVINENACPIEQYRARGCDSSIGTAVATTPLLRDPLRGPIYLVRNPARRIPDMMVKLQGEGIARLVRIDLTGKITIPRDLTIRTDFDTVPDVPVTKFTLRLIGGRKGPVGAVDNLCVKRYKRATDARLAFTAHSGRSVSRTQQMSVIGCGAARRGAARRGARRAARRAASRSARKR